MEITKQGTSYLSIYESVDKGYVKAVRFKLPYMLQCNSYINLIPEGKQSNICIMTETEMDGGYRLLHAAVFQYDGKDCIPQMAAEWDIDIDISNAVVIMKSLSLEKTVEFMSLDASDIDEFISGNGLKEGSTVYSYMSDSYGAVDYMTECLKNYGVKIRYSEDYFAPSISGDVFYYYENYDHFEIMTTLDHDPANRQGNVSGKSTTDKQSTGFSGEKRVHATGDANVRTGAGLSYDSIDVLKANQYATYLNESRNDERPVTWYKIEFKGKEGWVSFAYTEIVP